MTEQIAEQNPDNVEVPDPVTVAAQKAFGIQYLYPWQRLVIANILDAIDATSKHDAEPDEIFDEDGVERGHQIVLLPTGAGKSMCFLVPALMMQGITLILYPLLALMSDQERRMKEGGFDPVVFRGQQTPQEREENFERLKNGAKIVLANPEVLQSDSLLQKIAQHGIQHIAIDEAHCVSEWGDSFRPAYLTLGDIIKKLGTRVITAFTATASPEVLERIAEVLFDNRAHLVRSDSDRPNIHYYVEYSDIKIKKAALLTTQVERPLIIFCGTRKRTERLASFLRELLQEDDTVRFYHAGLLKEEKNLVEKWFYDHKTAILVATCAFGMGVDKKDIKTVIHLDPPPTAEAYIQEAGRGGRDGSVAKAILLWSRQDSQKAAQFAPNSRSAVLKQLAESGKCRRQVLLDALGGEEASCSGCDICEGTANFTYQETEATLTYLKKNRKYFLRDDFEKNLCELLNQKTKKIMGKKVYEQHDMSVLVSELLRENKIQIRKDFFWQHRLDICRKTPTLA